MEDLVYGGENQVDVEVLDDTDTQRLPNRKDKKFASVADTGMYSADKSQGYIQNPRMLS